MRSMSRSWPAVASCNSVSASEPSRALSAPTRRSQWSTYSVVSPMLGGDYLCDCDCSPGQLGCSGEAELQVSNYPPQAGFSPCTNPSYVYDETVSSGSSQSVSIPMDDIRGIVLGNDPAPNITGSCTPDPSVQPTPAGFDTRTIACGTFEAIAEGCGDGLCVPQPAAPYDSDVCIWAEGDLECPAGFDDRTVYHSDFTDTRSCSACSCGGPSGSCEGQSIRVRGWCDIDGFFCVGGPNCGPNSSGACEEEVTFAISELSACEALDHTDYCTPLCEPGEVCASCTTQHDLIEIRDITYDAGDPNASCPPSGGQPTGSVSGTSPTTICCSA